MLIQNPTTVLRTNSPYCAIRKRKPDGSPNTGRPWVEPMCSVTEFVEDQKTWEVVFYGSGDTLPP